MTQIIIASSKESASRIIIEAEWLLVLIENNRHALNELSEVDRLSPTIFNEKDKDSIIRDLKVLRSTRDAKRDISRIDHIIDALRSTEVISILVTPFS